MKIKILFYSKNDYITVIRINIENNGNCTQKTGKYIVNENLWRQCS